MMPRYVTFVNLKLFFLRINSPVRSRARAVLTHPLGNPALFPFLLSAASSFRTAFVHETSRSFHFLTGKLVISRSSAALRIILYTCRETWT